MRASRRGTRVTLAIAGLSLSLVASAVLSIDTAAQPVAPSQSAAASALPDAVPSDYVGSIACRACHRPAYEQWQQSVHVRMVQPAQSAHVLGDFTASAQDRPGALADVDFTLGEKRLQGYMSTLPDGRLQVLPRFWHTQWRRWIDWSEVTPLRPGKPWRHGAERAHESGERQIWNINCFNCHATNVQRNFDIRTRRYATTWSEPGVGCEACHGPGRTHVERLRAWGADPSSTPEIDLEAPGADLNRQLAIFVPRASSARQLFDSCAYCHGNKTNVFVGFRAGERFDDFAQYSLISDLPPANDPQGDYWADGRPSRFNRPQALSGTGCFLKGEATCATCHAAHGSPHPHSLERPLAESDALCTQCHRTIEPAHTHHATGSAGSRCINCHMSDVNWRLLTRRRDHTFAPPVPELTASHGIPNACTTCHDDRSPEWAMRAMDAWYGNAAARQRSVAVADAMYGAGAGGRDAAPLVRLAVDRTTRPLVRASAAGFLGRLVSSEASGSAGPAAATVNALVAAVSDPDSTVRVAAAKSLGLVTGPLASRAHAALAARLTDPSRVARTVAAEALLYHGITTLAGEAGRALARAQQDYADSLRTFPDESSRHTSLGWLLAAQGDVAAAHAELTIATDLDPNDARPVVFKAVLAARRGDRTSALALFERARVLDPAYPNIGAMIERVR